MNYKSNTQVTCCISYIKSMVQAKTDFVFTTLLTLAFLFPLANGQTSSLTCKKCDRVSSLDSCTGSTKCAADEICFMDEIITDQLNVVYTGGCRSKVVCKSGVGGASYVGKRSLQKRSDSVACSRCCDVKKKTGELECNARLCGIRYTNTDSVRCFVCDTDIAGAKQGDVDMPEHCMSNTTCQVNEACSVERLYDYGETRHKYTCLRKRICLLLTKEALKRKDECVANPDPAICGHAGMRKRTANNMCTACCGDGLCNSGSCEQVIDRLYNLWKGGVLDFDNLQVKAISTKIQSTINPDLMSNVDVVCPPAMKDHCYVVSKYRLSWFGAKMICLARHGKLFVPESMEEELFVEHYLNTVAAFMHYSNHSFWIGGRTESNGNSWLDIKGNSVERWAATIQNMQHQNDTSCIAMDGQWNFLWNRFHCNNTLFFICKEKTPYNPATATDR
ncbi:uncharacterized protein LOC123555592 [Mercenaria mercenaria]|uniref:uncharacterized protein LOC123555592 n=1 Tax=Mercenaria mercenaria TaxID=6596 RepID=UPI00234F3C98|nr:uncharacterized protein LOC123555592 [Mercenaria mercenaria]